MSKSVSSAPARCVAELLASPQLSPLFFGLKTLDGRLDTETEKFPCCEGTGSQFDSQVNAVRRCQLPARRRELENLLRHMQASWPEFEVGDLNKLALMLDSAVKARWEKFLYAGRQAWAFRVDPYKGPGWLWTAAAASIWRLGLRCQVLSFSSLRPEQMQLSGKNDPEIIFIEGVHKLVDPRRALLIEEIIAHAYNANIRLVMEFMHKAHSAQPDADDPQRKSFSTKGMLANRAAQLKRKDPLAFLEPNTRSRLESMCLSPRVD